jgi:hypothetical protein
LRRNESILSSEGGLGVRSPTGLERERILTAVAELDMSDEAVETAAGLPRGFLSKMRHGRCGTSRALASLAKLLEFLNARGDAFDLESVNAAREDEVEDARVEIAAAIRAAKSPKDVVRVNAMLGAAVALGEFDRFTAATLDQILGELRQALKTAREHEDRINPREPVKVVVEHLNDWQKNPVNCPSCGKTWLEALDNKRARDEAKGRTES